jgi:formylglycine-generating enzyme required for sulfatase activity
LQKLLFSLFLFMSCQCLSLAQTPGQLSTEAIPGSKLEFQMAYIPAGKLLFKGTEDKTQTIELDAFWIGNKEVSYDEFIQFQFRKNDNNTSNWKDGKFSADAVTRPTAQYMDYTWGMGTKDGVPSVAMTQQGALRYCQWLYQKTGLFYRLPTEAEWEYACKAGAEGDLPQGFSADKIDEFAWYYDNATEKYHPTGQKKANAWGLYDILGNVAEWTLDEYQEDYVAKTADKANNPWFPPAGKHFRTVRGGSFDDNAEDCTCTRRIKSTAAWQKRDPQIPKSRWWNTDTSWLGFRLVKPVKQPSAAEVEEFFKKAIVDQ